MIKMTGHRVLVIPDEVEETYGESQIVIVQDAKLERTGIQRGIVIDLGSECWKAFRTLDNQGVEHNGDPWCRVGDYVLFSRHAGRFVEDPFDKNKLYLVMNDEDILGVFHPGKHPIIDSPTKREAIAAERTYDH